MSNNNKIIKLFLLKRNLCDKNVSLKLKKSLRRKVAFESNTQ